MASPFQQQVRRRKILYIGLILALFTAAYVWRQAVMAPQAVRLALREESRGDVDLTGSVVQLGLTGSRGVVTCFLWHLAIEAQKKNQWNKLELLVGSLTKLQPHFITPWLFQSWNLAYNVSVESDRIRDKYFYISRGIELLGQGERQNRNHPDLRWSVGYYTHHKICQSDETNYQRSLFQLSLIPPNERDPARFWKQTDEGPEFNYAEFEKFVRDHPQLVRRLREGIHKENLREKKRLFDAPTPEAVVRFLEENFTVPSLYRVKPLPTNIPAHARTWVPTRTDEPLPAEARFPVLPPWRPDSERFDREALTSESPLLDEHDAYWVSHAWFCYAQEALPPVGPLPGSSVEITDRSRYRRPKHMTTLIFRHYPAQARRYMAERLQQEGWFDSEDWDASEWFQDIKDPELSGKTVKVGGGRNWSENAWLRAFNAWEEHGKHNKILFIDQAAERNMRQLAERFTGARGLDPGAAPPKMDEKKMSDQELAEYRAAQYMFEYNFYRSVSNFPHHLNRAFVEQKPETVACRKLFDRAEQLNLAGETLAALNTYRRPIKHPAWGDATLSPLDAWRERVLLKNKDYRRDNHNQEVSAEIQLRYLMLYNRQDGRELKRQLVRASELVPLLGKLSPESFRMPIVQGPFDGVDEEGVPLISDENMDTSMERMNLPTRRIRREMTPMSPPPDKMPGKGKTPPMPGKTPPPSKAPNR